MLIFDILIMIFIGVFGFFGLIIVVGVFGFGIIVVVIFLMLKECDDLMIKLVNVGCEGVVVKKFEIKKEKLCCVFLNEKFVKYKVFLEFKD